jgi:phenylpropionate dioxygenase-like ring-hydroxylating dioxygenase large terminal subunit
MPTETDESSYKDKIKIVSYPVEEVADILWTYMGPKDLAPEIPDFEYLRVPESHRFVSWNWQQTNYAQAIEGGIDSAHSNYLHSTLDAYHMTDAWRSTWERSQNLRDKFHARDQHPKFFAEDTDYGVITGARRDTGEGEFYWRYNLFLLPFYTMPPSAPSQKFFHAFVPIDDYHNMRWTYVWNLSNPLPSASIEEWQNGAGLHAASLPGFFRIGSSADSVPVFAEHFPLRNKENDYLLSRDYQKRLTFTGITGTGEQDLSVQEGMGHITPRNKEHLGTTDIGIIKSRRRLLKEANALRDGEEPYTASHGSVYYLRAGDVLLSPEENWVHDEKIKNLQTATW